MTLSIGDQEFAAKRAQVYDLSPNEFYSKNPELLPFDNGEGFFTLGSNKDVEMQEFEKYGSEIAIRDVGYHDLHGPNHDPASKAARKLEAILKTKSRPFARAYVLSVLDAEVMRFFMSHGGEQFFKPEIRDGFALSGFRFVGEAQDACSAHNSFSLNSEGRISARLSRTISSGENLCELIDFEYTAGSSAFDGLRCGTMADSVCNADDVGDYPQFFSCHDVPFGRKLGSPFYCNRSFDQMITSAQIAALRGGNEQLDFKLMILRDYLTAMSGYIL